MAIKIEFDGYVNEVRKYEWGVVYNVAHSQRAKNHQGEWETTGRDYFSVAVPFDSPTITTMFSESDRVEVVGKMKTKLYDKKDGSGKGVALEVRAESMSKLERGAPAQARPATVGEMQELWPNVKQIPDDTPF
jgi:single-stranded DNA-binding protein